jgi:hypothetical protein
MALLQPHGLVQRRAQGIAKQAAIAGSLVVTVVTVGGTVGTVAAGAVVDVEVLTVAIVVVARGSVEVDSSALRSASESVLPEPNSSVELLLPLLPLPELSPTLMSEVVVVVSVTVVAVTVVNVLVVAVIVELVVGTHAPQRSGQTMLKAGIVQKLSRLLQLSSSGCPLHTGVVVVVEPVVVVSVPVTVVTLVVVAVVTVVSVDVLVSVVVVVVSTHVPHNTGHSDEIAVLLHFEIPISPHCGKS